MTKKNLLNYLSWSLSISIMLFGFLVLLISVTSTPEHHWTRELVNEIAIAAISAGIVGFVYESLIRRELLDQVKEELAGIVDTDAKRLGVTEIYETRTKKADRVKIPELLGTAKKEIIFVGLSLPTIISEYRVYIEGALSRGCNIKFLVFDVDCSRVDALDASLSSGELLDVIKGSFRSVISFVEKIGSKEKAEVRLFDIVPTFGAIAIDREYSGGRIYVELNCYASSGDQCPGMKLEWRPNGLFNIYDRQITELWKASRAPNSYNPADLY